MMLTPAHHTDMTLRNQQRLVKAQTVQLICKEVNRKLGALPVTATHSLLNLHSCVHHTTPPVYRGYLKLWFKTNQPHCSCNAARGMCELRTASETRDSISSKMSLLSKATAAHLLLGSFCQHVMLYREGSHKWVV